MVTLSPKAAQRLKVLLAKQGKPQGCLRLRVTSGGCSGLSYDLELIEAPKPGDVVTEFEGAKLAVDAKSDLFVNGSEVDYIQTFMKSGFEVKNPKAASTCSCGTSFAVGETFSV